MSTTPYFIGFIFKNLFYCNNYSVMINKRIFKGDTMNKNLLKLSFVCMGTMLVWNAHAIIRDQAYLGAGVAATFDDYKLNATNRTAGASSKVSTTDTSALGDVFIGYGYTFDTQFYLAAELGTYFPRRSATLPPRPGVTVLGPRFIDHVNVQDYLTGDLLLGRRCNQDWLTYLRLGLVYDNVGVYQPSQLGTGSFRKNKHGVGERVGVGLNYALNDHWGIGADYYYTFHSKLNATWPAYNLNFSEKIGSNFIGLSIFYSL